MFLSPEEFMGDMPEDYKETLRLLRIGLDNCSDEVEASIIRAMLTDCGSYLVISKRYHERTYNNPRRLSMVQVRPAKEHTYMENEFERKLIEAIENGEDPLEVFGL